MTVVVSAVTTRLDYCNYLFFGTSATNFARPQRVQNIVARVLLRKQKFDHITSSLVELHRLLIQQRVYFKVALFTYNSIRAKEPNYLVVLCACAYPSLGLLSTSRARTVTASRAFRHSSVFIWNSFPVDIRI